jgi:GNAT superfamily N-acetyltransferase
MGDTRNIIIRQMLLEDAAAVADLTSQLGYPASESDIRRRYDRINRSEARLLVAQHANAIVGWIHVQVTYLLESDPRAEIWGLVVTEPARGAGVGRRLVEAAEQWAAMMGMNVVVLRSNRLRVEAQGFYEHLGYEVIKTQNAFRKTLKRA